MITRVLGRQPRRDRPPGVRHLPPPRHRHRRRLHRSRRRLPARRRGRRPGPPGGPQRLPGRRAADRRGPRRRAPTPSTPATDSSPRTPNSPPPCWTPGLTWIGPPVAAVAAMGSKIEAKKMMAAAGVPVLDELDPETVTADQLPVLIKASAGGGGRGMRVVRELSELPSTSGGRAPRGAVGVRRPDGVLRALPRHRPPRRGAGDRRRARHRVGGRRARVLDPAAPPEDHRRGAVAAGRTHSGHARQAVRRGPAGRRARSATPVRAPSSSWPTSAATSSSSR